MQSVPCAFVKVSCFSSSRTILALPYHNRPFPFSFNACAVRTGLNRDLGFSPGDRAESVRRVGEMACLFSGGGVITLVTLVSPYRADRDAARERHEAQGIPFLEVVMDGACSVRMIFKREFVGGEFEGFFTMVILW